MNEIGTVVRSKGKLGTTCRYAAACLLCGFLSISALANGGLGLLPPRQTPSSPGVKDPGNDHAHGQGGIIVEMRPSYSPVVVGTVETRRVVARDARGRIVAIGSIGSARQTVLRVPRGGVVRLQIEGVHSSAIVREGARVVVTLR
ncbi:MAG: hypothetical protein DHS20C15_08200 [Planctomycetota bacterium]|nr:MAG: hypothetical protein DHS20C15_08200 [Planctomycetota bacterium]